MMKKQTITESRLGVNKKEVIVLTVEEIVGKPVFNLS